MGSDVGITDTTSQIPLGIMKTYTLITLLCLMAAPAWATHLLGGQIQAKNISGNIYEITVVLFMDEVNPSQGIDPTNTISICMGDGGRISIPRTARRAIGPTISATTYRTNYNYSGPGIYRISIALENRTPMVNLSQAVGSLFSLATTIQTRGNLQNSTPAFEPSPEGWQVGTNQRSILNFRATDADGDSLSYALARPLTNAPNAVCSLPFAIDLYQFPNDVLRKGTYKLNARTGELVWDAPTAAGQYSAVILIREWRAGALISESYLETFIRVQDKSGATTIIPPYEPTAEVGIVTGIGPEADNDLLLTVSPNPVQNQFVARLRSNRATKATLQLLDLSGRVVAEKALMHPNTVHETTFLVETLPPGLYILKAEVGSRVISQKVMKQ